MLPPAGRPYKGRPVVGPSGHVPPVRLELTLPGSSCRCLLPFGLRGLRAATRCRPGPPAVRERGRSRARRQAARRGFEPRPPRPERGVLPVRRTGIGTGGAIRTGTGQDLSLLSAAIGLRPRAPPGSRSPFSGLRVQCITSHACGAWSRTGESNPDDLLGRQAS